MRLAFTLMVVLVAGLGCSTMDPATDSATSELALEERAPEGFRSAAEFDQDDVAAIHGLRDQWVSAFAAGDAAAVEFMLARDAIFELPEHPVLSESHPELLGAQLVDHFTAELSFDENSRFITDGGVPDQERKLPWVSYYSEYTLALTPKGGGDTIESSGRFMTRFHRQPDQSLQVARGPRIGDPAPGFALNLMKGGQELQLSSLEGKPTVLIFGSYT